MRDMIDDLFRAIGFLSRLPVPARFFAGYDGSLSRTVRAFPLAGFIIVLPAAALAVLFASLGSPPLLAAAIIVAAEIALTGALHEDGLADTADGLGAGKDRERALAIMKDSRTGVYGVLALVLCVLLRTAALATILAWPSLLAAGLALAGSAALSRALMVWHWHRLPSARDAGIAAAAGPPDPVATRIGLAIGLCAGAACFIGAAGIVTALLALAAACLAMLLFSSRTRLRIGGATGDTIGAAQQIAHVTALVMLALAG